MTFQRRHNRFFRRLAFLYAFLCVYPLVFKPLHLIGDLQEAAACRAAARAPESAWIGAGAAASAVRAADPADPPCAICAALTQMTVPAVLTLGCQVRAPLFVAVRFVLVPLRLNPCIFVSRTPARAPPASPLVTA